VQGDAGRERLQQVRPAQGAQLGRRGVRPAPGCIPVDRKGKPKDGHLVDFPHSADSGPQKDDDTVPAFVVPKDQYFVLGDNRGNSSDSRTFHGIERADIIGKAFVLIWPPTRFSGL
jgi:hypothetical protein